MISDKFATKVEELSKKDPKKAEQLIKDKYLRTDEAKQFYQSILDIGHIPAITDISLFCQLFDISPYAFDLAVSICNSWMLRIETDMIVIDRTVFDEITKRDNNDFRIIFAIKSGLMPNCMFEEQLLEYFTKEQIVSFVNANLLTVFFKGSTKIEDKNCSDTVYILSDKVYEKVKAQKTSMDIKKITFDESK